MRVQEGSSSQPVTLPFPQRKAEIISFVKKRHYSHRCPGVWQVCYALLNPMGKVQAVALYGPPPYPSLARRFTYPGYEKKLTWQGRMVGAGITGAQLDELIAYANRDLLKRGFFWILTVTSPTARTVEGLLSRVVERGYTGQVYHRNGFLYLGYTGSKKSLEGWVIRGKFYHIRQGGLTLSRSKVRGIFGEKAPDIRAIYAPQRQRWVYVLANNEIERAERVRLMRYRPLEWQPVRQPRLFIRFKLPKLQLYLT